MRETRFGDFYSEKDRQFSTKVLTVEPHTGRAVSLGIYPSEQQDPDFTFSFSPDLQDEIGIATSRLDIIEEGQYLMMLQLHNFSAERCTVTVQRTEK